jgi:hypothetical protein
MMCRRRGPWSSLYIYQHGRPCYGRSFDGFRGATHSRALGEPKRSSGSIDCGASWTSFISPSFFFFFFRIGRNVAEHNVLRQLQTNSKAQKKLLDVWRGQRIDDSPAFRISQLWPTRDNNYYYNIGHMYTFTLHSSADTPLLPPFSTLQQKQRRNSNVANRRLPILQYRIMHVMNILIVIKTYKKT